MPGMPPMAVAARSVARRRIDAAAVVAHEQPQLARAVFELDLDAAWRRMAERVDERLAADAIHLVADRRVAAAAACPSTITRICRLVSDRRAPPGCRRTPAPDRAARCWSSAARAPRCGPRRSRVSSDRARAQATPWPANRPAAFGGDVQLHRRAQEALQQRIVQLLRDAGALGQPLLEPHVELPRHLQHAQTVSDPSRPAPQHQDARDRNARRLPEHRLDLELQRRLRTVPHAVAVGRHHAKHGSRPGRGWCTPPAAPRPAALQSRSKPSSRYRNSTRSGTRQAQAGVRERDRGGGPTESDRSRWMSIGAPSAATSSICVSAGSARPSARAGIDDRQPARHREPDAAARVRDHGAMPLDPLHRRGARPPRRTRGRRRSRSDAVQQRVAIDAQHAIGGVDPERAAAILGDARGSMPRSAGGAFGSARSWPPSTHRDARRPFPSTRLASESSNSVLTSFDGRPSRSRIRRQPPRENVLSPFGVPNQIVPSAALENRRDGVRRQTRCVVS